MTLGQQTLSIIAVAAAAVAVLSLLFVLVLGKRLRRIRRASLIRPRPTSNEDLSGLEWPEVLSRDVRSLAGEVAELRDVIVRAVQRVGLVRFDAFEDMGGRLSFAAALLDAEGDGIVFSSINGRTETRIYAKPVEGGASRYNLSGEEEEAIKRALGAVHR